MKIDPRDLLSRTQARKLLAEIKRTAKLLEWTPSQVTHRFVQNGHIPGRLEAGGSVLKATAESLRHSMAKEIR